MEGDPGSCVPLSLFSVQSSFFLSHHIPTLYLHTNKVLLPIHTAFQASHQVSLGHSESRTSKARI